MVLTKTLSKRGRKDGEMVKRKSSVSKLQISAPVELISTTNMISYTAPPLTNTPLSATAPTTNGRFFPLTASTSPVSSPSTSDIESPSPPTSPTAVSNHLSTYFSSAPVPPPMSPARSLSTRSATTSAPHRSASSSSTSSRQQRRSQGPPPRASHRGVRNSNPFGAELAKVSEIAEEYGFKGVGDVDEECMFYRGLHKFGADDYLREIGGNFGGAFNDELPTLNPGWI